MEKIIRFNASITDIKPLNATFSLAKCRIFYTDRNRNKSSISKACAEEMAKTIAYTPVVGEWKEDIGNFGGHGGKITIKDNKVTYEDTTRPYGCVLDVPIWWETVKDENNIEREYMCCYLVLWTTRYPEAMKIIENGSYQSMEIHVIDGEQKDDVYCINKATFLALCILGKDEETPENTTEPCFEDSNITSANFEVIKDNFKKEFNLMIKDLKQSLLDDTSIFNKVEREVKRYMDNVEPIKKEQKKFFNTQQIYTAIDKALSAKMVKVEDLSGDTVEEQEFYSVDLIADEKMVVVVDSATWNNCFGISYSMNGDIAELDYENMKPYIRGEWRPVQEGETSQNENFTKVKEVFEKRLEIFSNKIVEKAKAEFNVKDTEEYKMLETELDTIKEQSNKEVDEEVKEEKTENDQVLKEENKRLKSDCDKLQEELNTANTSLQTEKGKHDKLNEDFAILKEKNEELLALKEKAEKSERIREVDKEISEFSLEDDEIKEIKERAYNNEISIDEMKKELFALEGMKAHQKKENFSKNDNKKESTIIKVIPTNHEEQPYGSLMSYFK